MKRVVMAALFLMAMAASAAAQPANLTPDCVGAWGRYSAAPGPKAFASGRGGCGWQIRTNSNPDMAAIRAQALRQCEQNAGANGGCRITSQSR